jgi:hypothetical protein
MLSGVNFPNLKILGVIILEDVENTQKSFRDDIIPQVENSSGIVGVTISSNSDLRLHIADNGPNNDAETDQPAIWIKKNQDFTIFMTLEEMSRTMKIWIDALGSGVVGANLYIRWLGQE